jgi:snurportin-1
MRLAELPRAQPPSRSAPKNPNTAVPHNVQPDIVTIEPDRYVFPYPVAFIPIPYHTNTTFPALLSYIIPLTRSVREFSVVVPSSGGPQVDPSSEMAVDPTDGPATFSVLESRKVDIHSDGLLLYVSQAGYEPGTSPLSSWIPITRYNSPHNANESPPSDPFNSLDLFER